MRRGLILCFVLLVVVPTAAAARRDVTAQATPASGAAPLHVTFTASDAVRWDFGDGTSGEGMTVEHVYAAGRWTAAWSSAGGSGSVEIVAYGVELSAPGSVRYGARVTFRGRVVPAEQGVVVTVAGPATFHATTRAGGTFVLRARVSRGAVWTASANGASTAGSTVRVVPQLRTGLVGSGARGGRYIFAASVRPKEAGTLDVTVRRGTATLVHRTFAGPARIRLDTRRIASYTIRARVVPANLYTAVAHVLRAHVVVPRLAFGARGAAVAQLAAQLRALHYAAPFASTFDGRLLDAVYAFEKVQGLPRIGAVGPAFWRRLADPRVAVPRYAQPAAHLEVDKVHQVLYVVRGAHVTLIVPVSTAGLPGKFTPTGRFSIYRKVGGFDPSPLGTLYDPMYFTGGYAIHGNPSVPPYPASHGCVRVPMWLAPVLFAANPYGETVYVY
ncbi:MAG: L,D-transpeptidase family protein [Gaiellaceae bacterium]